jgi:hypothetical protein
LPIADCRLPIADCRLPIAVNGVFCPEYAVLWLIDSILPFTGLCFKGIKNRQFWVNSGVRQPPANLWFDGGIK